ncbi:MAG: TMEM165/GDT1 family protein [Burkholderiaceae bacterium]|jgi:putative Ca2+/H+ antiporter (TMEM165/GDT1 family)
MEQQAFIVSTSVVALAEMGDKTQLLSLILAARYRKPMPIVLGILVATLLNHAIAGALGAWLSSLMRPEVLNWVMAAAFIAMGLWILVPDKLDEDDVAVPKQQMGVFFATVVAFFLAEMGDKTQFATIALAAQYSDVLSVVLGTTLGMMMANAPAVYLGNRFAQRLPTKIIHMIAAIIFIAIGVLTAVKAWL